MWDELERYKNHFIQHDSDLNLSAGTINELVQNEFDRIRKKRLLTSGKKHPPCTYPRSDCRNSSYFDDHTQLAYGWYALPKLVREMCNDDIKVQWRSTNTFSEFILNPIHAETALYNNYNIVRTLKNVLLRARRAPNEYSSRIEDKCLASFDTLSLYLTGARQISRRTKLIEELYKILIDHKPNWNLASRIMRNLTEKVEVLIYLLENTDSFDLLTKVFHVDRCKNTYPEPLWSHLAHFLEIAPEKALENGFFELLLERIKAEHTHFHRYDLKCFGLLIRCEDGQQRFDEIDGIKLMYDLLKSKRLVHVENVVLCLLNGLISKRAMWRAREFTDLPYVLLEYSHSTCNARLQLYCLQAIRQLGSMPCIKRYIRLVCEDHLKSMFCVNVTNECLRDDIVKWLNTEIYN